MVTQYNISERVMSYVYLDPNKIYDRFEKLLENKGLTVYSVAKDAGVSYGTIYKWRQRRTVPTLTVLDSLCNILDVPITYLLGTDDESVHLDEKEKQVFDIWLGLSAEQKDVLFELMKTMVKHNDD